MRWPQPCWSLTVRLGKFPLLPRGACCDKSRYGHTLVLAGSRRMTGAARLASEAALRSGSGLVTLASPKGVMRALRLPPEIMTLGLPECAGGSLRRSALGAVLDYARRRRVNVLAIGPGLSTDPQTRSLVRKLIAVSRIPVVLDADGLNAFRGHADALKKARAALVLTPHEREFKRLFGQAAPTQPAPRAALAKKLSKFYDVVLVLKGHRTLVVEGGRAYLNRTGNPGMAKGGTGDVLTGMIAAFIAQGLSAFKAAAWAVYFHGKAGDRAVKKTGQLGLTASDLIEALPRAFNKAI